MKDSSENAAVPDWYPGFIRGFLHGLLHAKPAYFAGSVEEWDEFVFSPEVFPRVLSVVNAGLGQNVEQIDEAHAGKSKDLAFEYIRALLDSGNETQTDVFEQESDHRHFHDFRFSVCHLAEQLSKCSFNSYDDTLRRFKSSEWRFVSSELELLFSIFFNNAELDENWQVVNYTHAVGRLVEQLKEWCLPDYVAKPPFEQWEREFV